MDKRIDMNRINEALVIMLADELHQYCMEGEARLNSSEEGDYFPDFLNGRIREIGEFLNNVGGFDLMSSVCNAMPYEGQIYLNRLWNRIGTWLA